MTNDDDALNCTVCGEPVRYGSRHHACGSVGHASDCATNNAPAYEPGPCDCLPTPQMCRAAVEYMNGADVYSKLSAAVLEVEEAIYAEVWTAMQAKAPFETSREREVREACSELRRAMGNPVISGRGTQTLQGQIVRTAASEIDKLRLWVKQADERGDDALRRAHAAEATLETVGRIDYVGQALELEACAERSTSQTAERAMRRAAQTLRTVATFAQPVPPAPQEPA